MKKKVGRSWKVKADTDKRQVQQGVGRRTVGQYTKQERSMSCAQCLTGAHSRATMQLVQVVVVKVVSNLHEGADDEAFCGGIDVALLGQPLQVLKGHHHAVPLLGGDGQLEAELVHRGALDLVQPPKNPPAEQTLLSICLCQIQSDHSSMPLLYTSNIMIVGNNMLIMVMPCFLTSTVAVTIIGQPSSKVCSVACQKLSSCVRCNMVL